MLLMRSGRSGWGGQVWWVGCVRVEGSSAPGLPDPPPPPDLQCPYDKQYPQWLQRTVGSIRHAPSSSPLRRSGRRAKLACEPYVPWAMSVASAFRPTVSPPRCRAIDARIIARSSGSVMDGHRVDDADDRRVDRRRFPAERLACGASFQDDEHLLAYTGADAVDREQRMTPWRVVDVQRLHQEQLRTFELAVLLRRDDSADDSSDLHSSFRNPHYPRSQRSTMPTIPASTGGSAG